MLSPNLRTLVVDDNATDRLLVRRMLERMGLIDVQVAEDGSIADSKIMNAEATGRPFEMVLLDWNMPSANGLKILQIIRHSKLTKSAKVMIMTSDSEAGVVESAVVNDANDFFVKPVNSNVLKHKIIKVFSSSKAGV